MILLKHVSNDEDRTNSYTEHLCDSLKEEEAKDIHVEDLEICGLDPGRRYVFTASYGEGETSHAVRRVSTKEYYCYTGHTRHDKKRLKRMEELQMLNMFLDMPSAKTSHLSKYHAYVLYVLSNLEKVLQFNNESTAITRLYLYQGVQRAKDEMCNILINGGRKYNKSKRKHTKKNRKKRKNSQKKKKKKKKEEESGSKIGRKR
jgi:hypothetical protein